MTALPRLCRSTLFKLVQQPSDHDSCADQPLCAFFSLKEKEPRRFPDDQGLSCCAPTLSPFLHPTATQPTRLSATFRLDPSSVTIQFDPLAIASYYSSAAAVAPWNPLYQLFDCFSLRSRPDRLLSLWPLLPQTFKLPTI